MENILFLLIVSCAVMTTCFAKPQYQAGADPYNFQYKVDDPQTNTHFGQNENGDVNGNKAGSYYVLLPDGRTMTVNYVADAQGYAPKIAFSGGGIGGGSNPLYG